jgi:hypothetical protein
MLNWIARTYLWVWHRFFQRDEPFTRQASRMEERWPAFTWGFALALYGLSAGLWRGWWIVLTVAIFVFSWWFLPHIVRYRVEHKGDNPPYQNKLLAWATKRINK